MIDNKSVSKNLLLNAVEFASRAAKDLEEKNYKFCLVNFCAAIEQIIKARLTLEHWSLIIMSKNLDSINKSSFESGDFKTISIRQALQRSVNFFSDFKNKHKEKLDDLFDERNKIVHFYSNNFDDNNEIIKIIRLIYHSWHIIYDISQNSEISFFNTFKYELKTINESISSIKEYFDYIYEREKNTLEKLEKAGFSRLRCPSCGYNSLIGENNDDHLQVGECHVCDIKWPIILQTCHQCKTKNLITESDNCSECGHPLEPEMDEIQPYLEPIFGDKHQREYAYCNICEHVDSVGYFNEIIVCSSCLYPHDGIYQCDYCGHFSTEFKENYYLSGCGNCEGALA